LCLNECDEFVLNAVELNMGEDQRYAPGVLLLGEIHGLEDVAVDECRGVDGQNKVQVRPVLLGHDASGDVGVDQAALEQGGIVGRGEAVAVADKQVRGYANLDAKVLFIYGV
jgi:hypothetical protein